MSRRKTLRFKKLPGRPPNQPRESEKGGFRWSLFFHRGYMKWTTCYCIRLSVWFCKPACISQTPVGMMLTEPRSSVMPGIVLSAVSMRSFSSGE